MKYGKKAMIFVLVWLCSFGNMSIDSMAKAGDGRSVGIMITEAGNEWDQLEYLDIFSVNEKSGDKTIAPGQQGTYDFEIRNMSSDALDYEISVSEQNRWEVPIEIRLTEGNHYVIGTSDTWVRPAEVSWGSTLNGADKKAMHLEWRWRSDQESEADELVLGKKAAEGALYYELGIRVLAESPAGDAGAAGRKSRNNGVVKTGDDSNAVIWLQVMISCGAAGILLYGKNRKKIPRFIKAGIIGLCCVSVGLLPSTLARYISSTKDTDTARPAHFDVDVAVVEGMSEPDSQLYLYSANASRDVVYEITNNSEVSVRCNVETDSELKAELSVDEFSLGRDESIRVTMTVYGDENAVSETHHMLRLTFDSEQKD